MASTYEQFVDVCGGMLRSIFPLGTKKSDPEASRAFYETWHHSLRAFDPDHVKANLMDWRGNRARRPEPKDIKERLGPYVRPQPGQGTDDRQIWEQDRHRMSQFMDKQNLEDLQVLKAEILMSNPKLDWLKDRPADSWHWRPILYCRLAKRMSIKPDYAKALGVE